MLEEEFVFDSNFLLSISDVPVDDFIQKMRLLTLLFVNILTSCAGGYLTTECSEIL